MKDLLNQTGKTIYINYDAQTGEGSRVDIKELTGYVLKSYYDGEVAGNIALKRQIECQMEESQKRIKMFQDEIKRLKAKLSGRDSSRKELVEEALIYFMKMHAAKSDATDGEV